MTNSNYPGKVTKVMRFGTLTEEMTRYGEITMENVNRFIQGKFDAVTEESYNIAHDRWEKNGQQGREPERRRIYVQVAMQKQQGRKIDGHGPNIYTPFLLVMPSFLNTVNDMNGGDVVAKYYNAEYGDTIKLRDGYFNSIIAPFCFTKVEKDYIAKPSGNRAEIWNRYGIQNQEDLNMFFRQTKLHYPYKDNKKMSQYIAILLNPEKILKAMMAVMLKEKYPDVEFKDFNVDITFDTLNGDIYKVRVVPMDNTSRGNGTNREEALALAIRIAEANSNMNRRRGSRYDHD